MVSRGKVATRLDEWTLLEKLGEGSFGKVFKAVNNITQQTAAVKIVPAEQGTGEVAREIETLIQCQSENIVHYYGSLKVESELWMCLPTLPPASPHSLS